MSIPPFWGSPRKQEVRAATAICNNRHRDTCASANVVDTPRPVGCAPRRWSPRDPHGRIFTDLFSPSLPAPSAPVPHGLCCQDYSFSHTNGRGTLGSVTTSDQGLTFTFPLVAGVGGSGSTDVHVMVGADDVQGSPFTLYVTDPPATSSVLTCDSRNIPDHNVKPGGVIWCNITVDGASGVSVWWEGGGC